MNSRLIKIIAALTMLIDHIGAILFPYAYWLRVIGRIAFPLFCFLIAYGCIKTRNINKFAFRLLWFGIACQIILSLASWQWWYPSNIFFTLLSGVALIVLIKKFSSTRPHHIILLVAGSTLILALTHFAQFDYGIPGVLLIVTFYLVLNKKPIETAKLMSIPILLLFNITFLIIFGVAYFIQFFSFLACIFIIFFTDKQLRISKFEKWGFYIFYPLHLVILMMIALLI